MTRPRRSFAASIASALLLLLLLLNAGARSARAAPAIAADVEGRMLDEHTALTLGARRLKLGVLVFDYGITDRVVIGTDPPAWAARAVLSVLVPNLHTKVVLLQREEIRISARAAAYYADISATSAAAGSILVVPLSLFASVPLPERFSVHGELTYDYVQAFGDGDTGRAEVNGTVATRSLQAGAMIEYRATRAVALTLRGRYQIYTGPLALQGTAALDQFTNATLDARATLYDSHPWCAVAGVAFLWRYVHLTVGAGYGNYFVPGIDLAITGRTFFPDASLALVF